MFMAAFLMALFFTMTRPFFRALRIAERGRRSFMPGLPVVCDLNLNLPA
jgi:hypothetical protein